VQAALHVDDHRALLYLQMIV